MEKKTRLLTVHESITYHPKIQLTGDWLRKWGFTIADQISVTSPQPGTLIIKVETPAVQMLNAERIRQAAIQLAAAEAQLKYGQSFQHPAANPQSIQQQ